MNLGTVRLVRAAYLVADECGLPPGDVQIQIVPVGHVG